MMTPDEARTFLANKRTGVGRPPREWSAQKREALKVLMDDVSDRLETSNIIASQARMVLAEGAIIAPKKMVFTDLTEVLSTLGPSNINW